MIYLDTSLLVKLYLFESDSRRITNMLRQNNSPAMISWLSEVEMASNLHAKMADARLGGTAAQFAYAAFRRDVATGLYNVVVLHERTFARASELAERYGARIRVRALDILHVAAALQHGAETFGTFDERQGRLAEAVGLKLLR